MKYKEYVEATRRTWNKKEDPIDNINHAMLGLMDEAGELAKQYKSNLAYAKELNHTNVYEEIGDLCYFNARMADELQFKAQEELIKQLDEISTKESDFEGKDSLNEMECVFAISSRVGTTYAALTSNDGKLIADAILNLQYTMKVFCEILEVELKDLMSANIAKLKARFPEKFTNEEALNRDLEKEEKAVEENVRDSNK
jgi:NTP pyrophosphatase (non-canonical NTP hydrolase)